MLGCYSPTQSWRLQTNLMWDIDFFKPSQTTSIAAITPLVRNFPDVLNDHTKWPQNRTYYHLNNIFFPIYQRDIYQQTTLLTGVVFMVISCTLMSNGHRSPKSTMDLGAKRLLLIISYSQLQKPHVYLSICKTSVCRNNRSHPLASLTWQFQHRLRID